MREHDRGDAVRLHLTTTDEDGAASDPSSVTLHVLPPFDDEQVITPPDVAHDGTGLYSSVLTLNKPGLWRYRWVTTGVPTLAEGDALFVRYDPFGN